MHSLWLALPVILCFGLYGQAPPLKAPAKSALDKATMEQYVRHLFVWGPQINVKVADPRLSNLSGFKEVSIVASAGTASQEETFFVSNDGQKVIRGVVYDVAVNPFAADRAKILTEAAPGFGPAGAPVSLTVYSDFQCSYCKEEAKVIRENLASSFPTQVRVSFKDFPLDAIHPWARTASIAGRCIYRQQPETFWEYHDWIFEHQADVTPENAKQKIVEFAKGKSIETIQLAACIDGKTTESEVDKSIAEARSLGVNSTPTLFVNGRRLVGNISWPQLKAIVEHEIEYQKANGAGEKCCEVKLPSPLN